MRKPRILAALAWYWVITAINRHEPLFLDRAAVDLFNRVLREAGKRFAIEVRHLVIYADRVSFYIKPADGLQLPEIMQWIKQTFACRYNAMKCLDGHTWGDRYWSKVIDGEPPGEEIAAGGTGRGDCAEIIDEESPAAGQIPKARPRERPPGGDSHRQIPESIREKNPLSGDSHRQTPESPPVMKTSGQLLEPHPRKNPLSGESLRQTLKSPPVTNASGQSPKPYPRKEPLAGDSLRHAVNQAGGRYGAEPRRGGSGGRRPERGGDFPLLICYTVSMANEYSADNIKVLKGLEAVRERPGMYIGTTGIDGLHHLVYEVVDNSVDEAMQGHCSEIVVALEGDDVVRVEDNGRGIPTDMHPEEKVSALELVLTRLHAGGKFDKRSYKVSGGLHGVGVSVVNALSEWCEASVHQNGTVMRQTYKKGIADGPVYEAGATDKRGTTIRFKADATIFETITYNYDTLAGRLRELAFLNSGLKITIRDERLTTPKVHEFVFEGGIKSFAEYLNQGKTVLYKDALYVKGTRPDGKDGEVEVECAIQHNDGFSEMMLSFVNDINTREGGTHLTGFKTALVRVLNDFLKKSKQAKKFEEAFSADDVREGLTAVLSVKVPNPQFEGQTKGKLGNSEVRGIVDSVCGEMLELYFDQHPEVINMILEKSVLAAKARLAARAARDATRRKNAMDSAGLPGKLADCSDKNPENCELFIVEGDSAGGSAKMGRNRQFQAILSLFGKMLNVEKTRIEKVITNEKLQPIIASIGAGCGDEFNVEKIRYHKIVIMADADVDGSHIRTLLLTFFYRYMTPLVESGHVFLAMPPLYRVSYEKKTFYAYDDAEKDRLLADSGRDPEKVAVSRYKGLGEMNPDQLWETTMDPSCRNMMQVHLDDAVEAERIFSTLMGENVAPRREFIEANALAVANLDV